MAGRLLAALALLLPALAGATPPPAAPTYVIEAIAVRGNTKTRADVIRRVLLVAPGERLAVDDVRFAASRARVLSLGFFSEVRLRLERGTAPGRAVLVVEVHERGTIIITDIFLGTSEATNAWGGFGVAERNLLGRGLGVEGAFVLGADPNVTRGVLQQAYWLRLTSPPYTRRRLEGSLSLIYLDGSEFFRRAGPASSSANRDFLSIRYRRIGATGGVGFDLSDTVRLRVDYRGEAIFADIPVGAVRIHPDGAREPIAFGIPDGWSRLSNVIVLLERDTRSDPVLPEWGSRLALQAQLSSGLIGSSYDYLKLEAAYTHYFQLPWRHVVSIDVFAGALFGEAPFFEKFFIGDLNDLLPGRALGLNFSTAPSRNFFGTSIDDRRYEEVALRAAVEYAIPWFRGGDWLYGGDFFVSVGVVMLTSVRELRLRDRSLAASIPVDLTFDAGLRLSTRIGIFRLSLGNALARIPF